MDLFNNQLNIIFTYFFVSLLLGIVSCTSAAIGYLKRKSDWFKHFLHFYYVFTLIILIDLINLYFGVTHLLTVRPILYLTLVSLNIFCFMPLIAFSIPLYFHTTINWHKFKKRQILIGILVLVFQITQICFCLLTDDLEIAFQIADLMAGFSLLYCICFGFLNLRGIEQSDKKDLLKWSSWIFLIGLILHGTDIILYHYDAELRLYPFFYILFSLLVTRFSIQRIFKKPALFKIGDPIQKENIGNQKNGVNIPELNRISVCYNISMREIEVLDILLQGRTNPEIGDKLCISLNTVKTHLKNIFKKTGVKNRFELITLFKNSEINQKN